MVGNIPKRIREAADKMYNGLTMDRLKFPLLLLRLMFVPIHFIVVATIVLTALCVVGLWEFLKETTTNILAAMIAAIIFVCMAVMALVDNFRRNI